MNFFGHAAVATWHFEVSPAFVLGAMLPDFWAMIRARPPVVENAELARGIRFHHLTDEVFHDSFLFHRLGTRAFDDLIASGLRRSSARAVAHIGVEILLDAVLAEDRRARDAYTAALDARELTNDITWSSDRESIAFRGLLAALAERGVSPEHRRPEIVALRIARALSNRPRLALDTAGELVVRDWAERASAEVEIAAPALLDAVRTELEARSALT